MSALPLLRRKFTPEEYLSIERNADYRSEYIDGDIYRKEDVGWAHATIMANLIGEIGLRLKGSPNQVMSRDMKVRSGNNGLFAYPDLLVVCGEQKYFDESSDVLLNPVVLIEILSPSTEKYDLTTKFDRYKQIDTLTDYVLVAQDAVRVEHRVRGEGGVWSQQVGTDIDSFLTLSGVPVTIALADIYDRLDFAGRSDNPA